MKSKNADTELIHAQGDVRTKLVIAVGVVLVCAVLGAGSIWFSFAQPDRSKDLWLIVGPILSATMSSAITLVAGGAATKRRH